MAKLNIDNADLELDPSAIAIIQRGFDKKDDAIKDLQARLDACGAGGKKKYMLGDKSYESMDGLYADAKKYYDMYMEYKNKKDSAEGRADALEKQLQERLDSKVDMGELVKQRLKLHQYALSHCDNATEEELFTLSDRQLKEKIVNIDGAEKRSDEALEGMLEATMKYNADRTDNYQRQVEIFGNNKRPARHDEAQAYTAFNSKSHNDGTDVEAQINEKYATAWEWIVNASN